jgi:hypothetical protein
MAKTKNDTITERCLFFVKNPPGWLLSLSLLIILLLVAGSVVLATKLCSLTKAVHNTTEAVGILAEEQELSSPGWVDLTFPDVQPMGLGFLVVDLAAESTDGGILVTGSIINTTTLNHYNVLFTIIFDETRSADFTTGTLKSGGSSSFEVIVPPAGDTSIPARAKILFRGSEVTYD